jgi:hypothetical protein
MYRAAPTHPGHFCSARLYAALDCLIKLTDLDGDLPNGGAARRVQDAIDQDPQGDLVPEGAAVELVRFARYLGELPAFTRIAAEELT